MQKYPTMGSIHFRWHTKSFLYKLRCAIIHAGQSPQVFRSYYEIKSQLSVFYRLGGNKVAITLSAVRCGYVCPKISLNSKNCLVHHICVCQYTRLVLHAACGKVTDNMRVEHPTLRGYKTSYFRRIFYI